MKKVITTVMSALAVVGGAFAEGTGVTDAMESISTELQGYISAAIPLVTALAVSMLGIWIIPKALKWIRSGVGR